MTSECRDQDMNMKPHKSVSLLLAGLLALLPMLAGAQTLERVRASNALTLGYLPDLAPFSSEESGKPGGYAIDLCLKVADAVKTGLGLSDMQVRYRAVSGEHAIAAITSGTIDILCSPTPETLERRKSVSYSRPVYTAGLSALVRKDAPPSLVNALNGEAVHSGPTWRATINQGLANHTFATIEGGVTEDWVRDKMRKLGVIATLVTVGSHEQGMQMVAAGKVDAFFAERMLLQHGLNGNGLYNAFDLHGLQAVICGRQCRHPRRDRRIGKQCQNGFTYIPLVGAYFGVNYCTFILYDNLDARRTDVNAACLHDLFQKIVSYLSERILQGVTPALVLPAAGAVSPDQSAW